MKQWLLMVACGVALSAHADIYKYVSASGDVIYTDHPVHGGKRLALGGHGSKTESVYHPARSKAETTVSIPHVDASTQDKRDHLRRNVLESELKTEQQALADALAAKKLAASAPAGAQQSSPAYQQRVGRLDEAVSLHQENVAALNRELARIR